MPRAPVTNWADVAAGMARMEEQIVTLQRERKEDKIEMREEVARIERVLGDGLNSVKADIAAQLAPIRTELAPLTKLRWQGAGVLIALMLLFGFLGHKLGDSIAKLVSQG